MAEVNMEHEVLDPKTHTEAPDILAYWKAVKSGHPGTYWYVSLLGLHQSEPLEIVRQIEQGLSFRSFERFRRNSQFSTAVLAGLVAIKTRTLQRRKEQGRLAPEESDRLLRVTRLFSKALELFEGDAEAARNWFHEPARALGGAQPIALARTDLGSREVETLIDRLEHGVLT